MRAQKGPMQKKFDRKKTGNNLANIKLNYCTLILYLPVCAALLYMQRGRKEIKSAGAK